MAKIKLPLLEDLSKDSDKFFDVLNGEPDFAVVLITGAYLDACLAGTLAKYLADSSVTEKLLDPRSGWLGTYSARTDLGYVLGLVPKMIYQDLTQIGSIRNAFAHHHLGRSFAEAEITAMCAKLAYVDGITVPPAGEPLLLKARRSTPRDRFVITAALISQTLLVRGLGLERRTLAT